MSTDRFEHAIASSGRRWIIWLVVICIGGISCAMAKRVTAQTPQSSDPLTLDLIPSWPVDLVMTQRDERLIIEKLLQPCPALPTLFPLAEFAAELDRFVPVRIDRADLAGLGLTADVPIAPLSLRSRVSWLTQMIAVLEPVELTVHLQHKVLHVTTEESTESNYPVRVYNITSLVGKGAAKDRRLGVESLNDLIHQHISPHAWERLGGVGTVTPSFHGHETLLTISASTLMHWQLQALLNQMMVAGKVRVLETRFQHAFQSTSVFTNQTRQPIPDAPKRTSRLPLFQP